MTTYYFDGEAGSDGNNGTSTDTPKKNPSSVTFVAGDVCLLNRGKVWVAPAGTQAINIPANNVRVGAYGIGERPYINCAGVSRGVNVGTNIAGWIIEDLHIGNVASGTSRRGIVNATTGSSETVAVNGTIRRVKIDGVLSDLANDCNGIALVGDGNKILDSEISNIATDGIWVRARNIEIGRCTIANVATEQAAGRAGEFGDGIQFGGAGASDFSGAWVHDNVVDHTSVGNAKNTIIVNGASATQRMIFERNVLRSPVFTNHTALYLDAPGIVCVGNVVEGGDFGIYAVSASGALIACNRVIGSNYGIRLASSAAAQRVYHNVMRACGTGFYGTANDATTALRNNVFLACATGLLRHINMVENNNCFFGNTTNASYTGGSSSLGGASIVADPLLGADDAPLAGSPLIGAASWVALMQDRRLAPFKNAPSIGASEYWPARSAVAAGRSWRG